ncbi:hypothetical protein PGO_001690 [Plasmodium gonderi]|uniref:Variable surface protein n=1 Tax=Plasmodium gonderi TaxID=77519 RepID=A0A1Y1JNP0_PLAGO|nr:hypothetical protein PGO_001690 [Plasmodium gonderi]GAW84206.1 hypothetical protein PGO_001690 [Plasmodium gonderi]
MQPKVVVIYDDSHRSTFQDCNEKYLEFLLEVQGKNNSFNNKSCADLCSGCNEINNSRLKLKEEGPKEILAFFGSYLEQQLNSFCKRCYNKCKNNSNVTCCNEEKDELKLDAGKVCEGGNVCKGSTAPEIENLKSQHAMDPQISEPKASESKHSKEQHENRNIKSESREENENSNKLQETMNTVTFDEHKEEAFSSITKEYVTVPSKGEVTGESLYVTDDSANRGLDTKGNSQFFQARFLEVSNTDDTQEAYILTGDAPRSKSQEFEGRANEGDIV